MHRPVWLYWENFRNKPEPAYITLCRWTMLHNWRGANLIFLDPNNIDCYLPGISRQIEGIESSVKGRLDRWSRKFFKKRKTLAVKADVIRASMLREYGGLYADSSTIALGPLDRYFTALEKGEARFLVSQRSSHGRSDYPVSFYGCTADSKIINGYAQKIHDLLEGTKEFDYNGLGTILMTPFVEEHLDEAVIIPEKEIMPITYEDADAVYRSKTHEPGDFIGPEHALFKLFNAPFNGPLADYSVEQLYFCDLFIGRLFRHALPLKSFEHFRNCRGDLA